ncbi:MAG: sigma-54-dependent Fis family transcriptional regulator [Deltaproteobacteria bacterium]|nr:sigma-54-dependent Fis family transcriptional regulator [Deltaproteobacteria bacterium]
MKILVIDDEESMRHMLSVILKKEGYDTVVCEGAESALKVFEKEDFDFVLSDIRMPGLDGPGLLKKIKKGRRGRPLTSATIIMMSAYGTMDVALECMKLGAYDYISKPFKVEEIIFTLKKAEEREKLKRENERLKEERAVDTGEIYTEDKSMLEMLEFVRKVSDYDTTVLVTGETGTGKELIARALHFSGKRAKGPFVAVNCGAIPENLLESELFGHVKGAFTDAVRSKVGLFEEAQGGTIFLDEIGELPLELQVKLLRVLQEGEIRRLGDTLDVKIDARVVAATVRDLEAEVSKGNFREDLFYRLNIIPIAIAPLRDRCSDIPGLAKLFIDRYALKYSKGIEGLSDKALNKLLSYGWPGNVRELENLIERAVILEDSDILSSDSFPAFGIRGAKNGTKGEAAGDGCDLDTISIKKGSIALEKRLIVKAMEITKGNKTRAAELLEISHRALLYKIKGYNL